jgi:hypothetical protein
MVDWKPILQGLSDKIQGSVFAVIDQRNTMPVKRFKGLLDKQAQDAILEMLRRLDVGIKLVSEGHHKPCEGTQPGSHQHQHQ